MKFFKETVLSLILAVISLLAMLVIYTAFAPIDIVFIDDGEEVYRQENAFTFARFDDPFEHIDNAEEIKEEGKDFFYSDRGGYFRYSPDSFKFRFRIAKTTLKMIFTWDAAERYIVCTSYYTDSELVNP